MSASLLSPTYGRMRLSAGFGNRAVVGATARFDEQFAIGLMVG
ncbi:hypothetical protein ABH922_001614 [Rhodococcus sp. 27YEA15]